MPDPTADLPLLPLLAHEAPVLRRSGGRVQVGLEPHAVVLAAEAAALLPRLDGCAGLEVLREDAPAYGLSAHDIERVLRGLLRAGLLLDAGAGAAHEYGSSGPTTAGPGRATAPTTGPVRLIGLGPLGQQVAALLLGAGVHVYATSTEHRRTSPGPPVLPDGGLARGPGGSGRLILVNHWSKPDTDDVAVTVVATDTAEPDRVLTEWLLRADQAHLVLRSAGRSSTVGPFVLPGQTACLRCTDLRRREVDPDWPELLPQLAAVRPPTSALMVSWAAAVGAAQVLTRLRGGVPETAGATVELDEVDHLTRWRRWPLHAGCGCAWPATTEWGA